MGRKAKRVLSLVAALMLLLTCALSGLVLPVAATNLIVNGDFEDGETNWKTSSSNANAMSAVGDGYGTDGSAGLKLTTTVTTAQRTVGSAYQGAFNELLEPYTTYIFSFDYKVEGSGVARIDVLKSGTDWTGDWKDTDYTATTWTHEEIEFTTGAAENMDVRQGMEWRAARVQAKGETGTGATYFDNFSLEKKVIPATAIELDKTTAEVEMGGTVTLTPTAVPSGAVLPAITWISSDETVATVADGVVTGVAVGTATITATAEGLTPVTCDVTVVPKNLLVNGNFEGGNDGWGTDAAATIAAGNGKDGSIGLKIETTVLEGGTAVYPGPYYKGEFGALLEPNTTYQFSFYYKTVGKGSAKLDVVNGVGSDWTGWDDVSLPDAAEWTLKTIEFTTGAEENMVRDKTGWEWKPVHVHFANSANYGTGSAYFDDFKLVEKQIIPLTEVSLNKTAAPIEVGQTSQLKVNYAPVEAAPPVVTWQSNNEAVATVDTTGLVTAVAEGTATVTATVAGFEPLMCEVTVATKTNMLVNGDFESENKSWEKNEAVEIADGNGKDGTAGLKIETTVAEGGGNATPGIYYNGAFMELLKANTTYIFSFDYKNEGKGFGQIDVVQAAGSDWLGDWKDTSLLATEWTHVEIEFTTGAAANISASKNFEWKARRVQYASAVGSGATYFDNFCLVEKPIVPLTEVSLNKTTAPIEVGQTSQLRVNYKPVDGTPPVVTWSSADEAVATVDTTGLVTAVAEGTATVTATVAGFEPLTCTVTVSAKKNLLVNGDFESENKSWEKNEAVEIADGNGKDGTAGLKIETNIAEGAASHQQPGIYYIGDFNAILEPYTTYILSFDYKNEGKGFGQIDVVKAGTDWQGDWKDTSLTETEWTHEVIQFTTGAAENMNPAKPYEWKVRRVHYTSQVGTGVTYFDNFRLEAKPIIPLTEVSLNKTTAPIEVGQTSQLAVNFKPVDGTPPMVTWTSTDETVATVDTLGLVTAVAEGTATVTATVAGFEPLTCAVTVTKAENVLINGDFETGNKSWGTDAAATIADGNGKDGTAGLKIETTVAEGDAHKTPGIYYIGDFNAILDENAIYKLSFDYKNEGQGFGQIDVVRAGTDWTGWADTDLKETEWTHKEIIFNTGAAQNMNPQKTYEWKVRRVHYNSVIGTGVTYFDNFKLVKVGDIQFADEIHISPESAELFPLDTMTLAVATTPVGSAKGFLTWSSSAPDVVSVDQNGKVTALKTSGSATITVTNDKGKTDTCEVTISENANIIKNGDFELGGENWANVPNIKPGIGRDGGYGFELTHEGSGSWTSYYYKGSLVGLLEPATTYEWSIDYLKVSDDSEVRTWTYDMGIAVSKSDFEKAYEWQTYTKKFTTPTDLELRTGWDISFVCEATGTNPTIFDNFSIRKYSSGVEAESIVLSLQSMTLIPGRTGAVTAYAQPGDADLNDMVWTSSDENVATVEYGVVMGVGKGTATITGTTKNGKSASCTVTVSGNDTLIQDGSFDTSDHSKWTFTGSATIVDGKGRVNSDAVVLDKDSTVKQTFTGLKAETPYQLIFRYRSETGNTAPVVTLTNGTAELVKQTADKSSLWKTATYEFTTGTTVDPNTTVVFTADGNGVVYVDNIVLAVKASLVDFEISNLVLDTSFQVKTGTPVTFATTVVNTGEDPAKIGQVIEVEIRKNGKAIQTLAHTIASTMNPGDSILIVSTAPWTSEKGDWTISAAVNPNFRILELDGTNNSKQVFLRVADTLLEAPKEAQAFDMTELVFSDEFDSYDSIDMYATGADGYKWYVTRPWGYGTITPEDYTVENGIIKLHQKKGAANNTLATGDAVTGVGWEYHFGYLEARLRIPNPNYHENLPGASGGIPAIWSFPMDKWNEREGYNDQWVEMDWLEYWGRDLERWPQYPDGYFTVTLHDEISGRSEEEDRWWSNSNAYCNGLGNDRWQTMGWLWTYNGVITYIDGVEVHRISYSEDGESSSRINHHSGSRDHTGAFSYMNVQSLMLYISGAIDFPLELDYIRVWQGSTPKPMPDEETEEGDGQGGTIDISAEDFWNNYCTDIYGDPIMTVTYANCDNILAGEEVWEQLSDARKAEINALLKEKGQKSFEELLAAAKVAKEKGDPDSDAYDQEMVDAKAEDFVWYWLSDDDGNPILEVTTDNFEFILECIAEWNMLDDAVKEAIERILAENGQPTFAELVRGAMILALQNGWAVEDLPEFDFGEEIDWSEYLPDEEPDEPVVSDPETPTKKTAPWVLPVAIGGGVLVLAAAAVLILLLLRKKKNNAQA